ncbi:MAG: T9SS type A sorting domain-containing protein [Phycisphaerae bacterium]|nr:T9SS type A sorting domain-containing protein [Saprospiraceae bacterium]
MNFGDGSPFYSGIFDTVSHTYAAAGIYQVCLEISNFAGSCTDKYCFLVNLTSAAHEPDIQAIQVEISPNPTSEQTRVSVQGANPQKVQLFDVFGKMVWENPLFAATFEIETRNLPAGVYWLQVLTDKGMAVRKVVVAR